MLALRQRLLGARAARTARAVSSITQQHLQSTAQPAARFFHTLGLSRALSDRLTQLGLTTPTSAQCKAIPPILAGEDVVVAAETGGGKTLSFLLPVVEKLRRNPLPPSEMRLPAALVLTTSQELVRQLAAVLHQVDPELARLAVSLSSSRQTLGQHGSRACPLVLATPGALLRATKPRDFAFTQMVVVDEADMLLSGGFEKETKQILATIRNQPLLRAELNSCTDSDGKDRDFDDDDFSADRTQTIFSAISSLRLRCIVACAGFGYVDGYPVMFSLTPCEMVVVVFVCDFLRDDPRLRQAFCASLHRLQVPVDRLRYHRRIPPHSAEVDAACP